MAKASARDMAELASGKASSRDKKEAGAAFGKKPVPRTKGHAKKFAAATATAKRRGKKRGKFTSH
jgi:hypothetical protein